jgi:hypothetical protein
VGVGLWIGIWRGIWGRFWTRGRRMRGMRGMRKEMKRLVEDKREWWIKERLMEGHDASKSFLRLFDFGEMR